MQSVSSLSGKGFRTARILSPTTFTSGSGPSYRPFYDRCSALRTTGTALSGRPAAQAISTVYSGSRQRPPSMETRMQLEQPLLFTGAS